MRLELSPITGTVELSGLPFGAEVRETPSGPVLGQLPARLVFPPGQRLLVVSAEGFVPTQLLVTVHAEQATVVSAQLTPQPSPTGKVVVTANRDSALVRVDGKDAGFQ
ncbi:MAG: PEGA domain-containing protein, partial [Archangiaceae bacterium]|nr:PEGA domain-containing protein [Archangiaceae bacterium]